MHFGGILGTDGALLTAAYSNTDREATSNPEHGQRWMINTSAFYAHMHALDGGMLSTYRTWTMRDAFEPTPAYPLRRHGLPRTGRGAVARLFSRLSWFPRKARLAGMLEAREPWVTRRLAQAEGRICRCCYGEREGNLRQTTRQLAKKSADLMETA